jgi:PII-like signaling protein
MPPCCGSLLVKTTGTAIIRFTKQSSSRRAMHLAGATVMRGPMGYGHSSRLHTAKILRLSEDLPLVIEIVDSQERIDAFLPVVDAMMTSGLVTIEKVRVLQYGPPRNSASEDQ